MTRRPWFRRRPRPRQSKVKPIRWEGYALLIGGILVALTPMLWLRHFGFAWLAAWPIWLMFCLIILFVIVAHRTEN